MKKKKLVYGVGINDADYPVQIKETICYVDGKRKQKLVWICPFYQKWVSMMARCYSPKYQDKYPTYKDCFVCEEWKYFSNFKEWISQQSYEGKVLDKDILVRANKVYSPETCVLVDSRVNNFLIDSAATRGKYLLGVTLHKQTSKFSSTGNNFGQRTHLGLFDTELEAHKAWLAFKLEQAKILAAEQTDPRVAKALIERYENYVVEGCDKS